MSRDLYVLCLVMLQQQFDTMLKCFIIKKKSVYRLKHFFFKVDILTIIEQKSLMARLNLTFVKI